MKLLTSLGLLATLTAACGGSKKSSDKSPDTQATAPVVSVDANLDTHSTNSSSTANSGANQSNGGSQSNSGNSNDSNSNESNTGNDEGNEVVEEATKPLPEAFVGFGYNTFENQVKESCLTGTTLLDTGLSSSAVSFLRYETYQSFYKEALKAVDGSVLNTWAGSDFNKKFFAMESSQSLSANYVFASSVISGTKRFNNSQIAVSLNSRDFHNKCGNKYVNSAVVGGVFVAKVSLYFQNEAAKLAASSESFDYSHLAQVLVQESAKEASERSISTVEISYGQIGGGGVLLTHMNTSDILKCSLDNQGEAQKCASTLEKLASYAVSQSFLDSIKNDPAVLSFTLGDY